MNYDLFTDDEEFDALMAEQDAQKEQREQREQHKRRIVREALATALLDQQERKQTMKTNINKDIPQVVLKAINEAINKLRVTGCAFKIILPNGSEHLCDPNNLLDPAKVVKRQRKDRPYGSLLAHYKPFVENMKTGDVAIIPRGSFTFAELQSAVTAWCCQKWGNGSVTSSKNVEKDTIELLKLK